MGNNGEISSVTKTNLQLVSFIAEYRDEVGGALGGGQPMSIELACRNISRYIAICCDFRHIFLSCTVVEAYA